MREMKDSGIEWIGEIPGNWKEERLKFLCSITTGNEDTQNANPEGMYPFYVRSPEIEKCDRFTFDGEGILVAGDGAGAGRVFHYATGKYAIHQRVYLLHDIKLDGRYLHYYVSNIFPSLMNFGSAQSTVPSLRLPMLQNFNVVYPSFHIQKNIASFLDTKCAEIDALTADIQKEIETLQEYRKSVITEAVTKGLDPNVEMKDSGIEWIGDIPRHWTTIKLKNTHDGMNVGESIDKEYWEESDGDIVFYTAGLNPITTTYRHFPPEKYTRDNDLLLARNGTPYVYLPIENSVYTDHIIRVKIKDGYSKKYIMYCLERSINAEIVDTVSIATWSSSIWNRQCFPLPSYEEQKVIASFLDSKCSEIDSIIADKQKQLETLAEYRKSLIYEYVTGKKEVPKA